MQDYITKQSLLSLGITLADADADSLIAHFNDVVEQSIGEEIMDLLSEDEIDELVVIQESADDEALGAWITAHVPDYEQIVSDNIDIAIADMVEAAEEIIDAADKK